MSVNLQIDHCVQFNIVVFDSNITHLHDILFIIISLLGLQFLIVKKKIQKVIF